MHALVTGATGFLGRHLVEALLARGHRVTGVTRDRRKADVIADLGADVVVGDMTDLRTFATTHAEAVFHLASEPAEAQGREVYREIDIGGAASLRASFPDATTHFIYASSIWVYGSSPDLVGEATPIQPTTALGRVKAEVERSFLAAPRSTVFRFGMIYPGGAFGERLIDPAYRRFFFYPGPGDNVTGVLSIHDAVAALVGAAERNVYGIYNLVDDQPLEWRRIVEIVHEMTGGTRPRAVPGWLVRLLLGEDISRFVTANLRVSNAKAKAAGFAIRDADFAIGFARAKGFGLA